MNSAFFLTDFMTGMPFLISSRFPSLKLSLSLSSSLLLLLLLYSHLSFRSPVLLLFHSFLLLRNKDLLKELLLTFLFLAKKWLPKEDQGIPSSLIWGGGRVINKRRRLRAGYKELLLPIKPPAVHVEAFKVCCSHASYGTPRGLVWSQNGAKR